MGSIYHIVANPERWNAYITTKRLKEEYGGDRLYHIRYGLLDDDPCGCFDLEMLMRESIFQGVMSGEYTISNESKYKQRLILLDKDHKEIPPLSSICY